MAGSGQTTASAQTLRQNVKGLRAKTVSLSASSADIGALKGLMAGEVEEFKTTSSGGTTAPLPSNLNRKALVVGKKTPTGRLSVYVNLPHVKEAKTFTDLETSMVGQFDASYTNNVKCEYATLMFDA